MLLTFNVALLATLYVEFIGVSRRSCVAILPSTAAKGENSAAAADGKGVPATNCCVFAALREDFGSTATIRRQLFPEVLLLRAAMFFSCAYPLLPRAVAVGSN